MPQNTDSKPQSIIFASTLKLSQHLSVEISCKRVHLLLPAQPPEQPQKNSVQQHDEDRWEKVYLRMLMQEIGLKVEQKQAQEQQKEQKNAEANRKGKQRWLLRCGKCWQEFLGLGCLDDYRDLELLGNKPYKQEACLELIEKLITIFQKIQAKIPVNNEWIKSNKKFTIYILPCRSCNTYSILLVPTYTKRLVTSPSPTPSPFSSSSSSSSFKNPRSNPSAHTNLPTHTSTSDTHSQTQSYFYEILKMLQKIMNSCSTNFKDFFQAIIKEQERSTNFGGFFQRIWKIVEQFKCKFKQQINKEQKQASAQGQIPKKTQIPTPNIQGTKSNQPYPGPQTIKQSQSQSQQKHPHLLLLPHSKHKQNSSCHKKQLDSCLFQRQITQKFTDYSINLANALEAKNSSYYRVKNARNGNNGANPGKFISERISERISDRISEHGNKDSVGVQQSNRRSYQKLITQTQQSSHSYSQSQSKRKKYSTDLFTTETIKAKARKQNHKLLQKQKQNLHKKQNNAIRKLKLKTKAQYQYQYQCQGEGEGSSGNGDDGKKIRQSLVPWSEITEISRQIASIHVKQNTDNDFGNISKDQQTLCKAQLKVQAKQLQFQKTNQKQLHPLEKNQIKATQPLPQIPLLSSSFPPGSPSAPGLCIKIQETWQKISKNLVSRINPIGQAINQTIQLSKRYGVNSLKGLYLLYKKFFYMRTALLSGLVDQAHPIFGETADVGGRDEEDWRLICRSEQYKEKVKGLEEENQCILRSLVKMQRKLPQKDKCQPDSIYQISITNQKMYTKFSQQMLRSNISIFNQLEQLCKKSSSLNSNPNLNSNSDTSSDIKIILQYGKSIMFAVLDQVEDVEEQYQKILAWVDSKSEGRQVDQVGVMGGRLGELMGIIGAIH